MLIALEANSHRERVALTISRNQHTTLFPCSNHEPPESVHVMAVRQRIIPPFDLLEPIHPSRTNVPMGHHQTDLWSKCISFQQQKDTLHQHLSIGGVGDRTIGMGTRELAMIPRSNCLPGNTTGQELEWRSISEVGVRHSRIIGKLVDCWWKW